MSFFSVQRQSVGINSNEQTTRKEALAQVGEVTRAEVAKHSSRSDCWMILNNVVYDVTNWIDQHPGGELMLSYAGLDATDVFDAFHEEKSTKYLTPYKIGWVKPSQNSVELEHQRIKKMIEEKGLYESSKLFYVYKVSFNMMLALISSILLVKYQEKWISGVLLAFFFQQNGWLSHDFLHHQVFKNRSWNNWMGYFLGNVCQGFSVTWWKAKHNMHHAVPNIKGFDPDIDTMPFLAWSEKMIEGDFADAPPMFVKHQAFFFLPLMCMARFSWLIQSLLFALARPNPSLRMKEVSTLCIHYAWMGALIFGSLGLVDGLLFIFFVQALSGLLLATAFTLNHNGMEIFDQGTQGTMDFSRLQILTGRDVLPGPFGFFRWFMGGLDMQIEHHLFPKVPRHNLPQIQKAVQTMCKDNGVVYHETTFVEGAKEIVARLHSVATVIKKLD